MICIIQVVFGAGLTVKVNGQSEFDPEKVTHNFAIWIADTFMYITMYYELS